MTNIVESWANYLFKEKLEFHFFSQCRILIRKTNNLYERECLREVTRCESTLESWPNEVVFFHVVRRIPISRCISMRARNFLSWIFFFKLPVASHSFSGVWTSYATVTCLVSIPGPSKRLRGWVWVRKPSSAFSLQLGFSKLTPIYFFKNTASAGCLPHAR